MASATPHPSQFSCPACPAGALLLSVEMEDHTIYACNGPGCGASLWLPTDHGRVMTLTEQLRIARIALASKIRKMAAASN